MPETFASNFFIWPTFGLTPRDPGGRGWSQGDLFHHCSICNYMYYIVHSGLELWVGGKKCAWYLTITQSLGIAQGSKWAIEQNFWARAFSVNWMFLIMVQPKTNCIFRTFRLEESFWTKKQSCNLSKVGIKKWRPFFDFVCFNGCHFT